MNHVASPDTSDTGIERQLRALGKDAPRVTPEDLQANIVSVEYVRHDTPSGQILRWAVLTTKSGFAVTGKPSAAVSAENDVRSIGEKTAYDNAINELWAFMGYELKARLHRKAAFVALHPSDKDGAL